MSARNILLRFNLPLSLVMYLIISFIKWDITWILEVPTYDQPSRGFMIFIYITLHAITFWAIKMLEE